MLKGSDMCRDKEPSQILGNLLFPNLFHAFRMAVHPKKLAIAFLAVLLILTIGWLMDLHKAVVVEPLTRVTELHIYVNDASRLTAFLSQSGTEGLRREGLFHTLFNFGANQFHQALYALIELDIARTVECLQRCFTAFEWALRYHTLYSLVFFILTLCILCLAGGALCRAAALQFAQGERAGLVESLRFSIKRFMSLLAAPLIPIGIFVCLGMFIACLGLVGNVSWIGELLIAVGMPLVLGLGCVALFIVVGVVCGFNLMFPTIAFEDSDCFVAINNAFRFVYARPWYYGFYTFVSAIYGAVCYIFVRVLAFGVLLTGYRFLQWGFLDENAKLQALWPEPTFVNLFGISAPEATMWTGGIAVWMIRVSVLLVVALLIAFVMSFYYSWNTIIYALLRRHVDDIPLNRIQPHSDASETPREDVKQTETEPKSLSE